MRKFGSGRGWDIRFVQVLLNHFKNDNLINSRSSSGEIPLHLAVGNPKCTFELIELLLNHGADVNVRDAWSRTAYQAYCYAVSNDSRELSPAWLMMLQSNEHQRSLLHEACLLHDFDAAFELLSHGADVNANDDYGLSPMFYALNVSGDVKKRKGSTFRLLLEYGADTDELIRYSRQNLRMPEEAKLVRGLERCKKEKNWEIGHSG
ncbi:ankyrin repeat domain-containing protein 39 homolog [Nasonia vitripennis]|uniref:Uncharacterized protein n=1 Tax=Nasonia vitripennis TaxID=7425 RepID=A0A7M7HAL1_NASVI|nr:ankyrin repeat domain-containing protein 39 homolog [Nasonia vitripennis]